MQRQFFVSLGYDISTSRNSFLSCTISSGVASLVLKSAIVLAGK